MANDITVKISAITAGFDGALNQVEQKLKKLDKAGSEAGTGAMRWGDRFTKAGKALLPASIAAGAFETAAVKLGSEFQKQMGSVQAIAGTTGTEMQKLKQFAMDATKGTKFSAIEAGQAYEFMGMAGWKTGQMVDGLKPILNLATAANTDLGTTSDIVTDSLTAFGLKAKDTAMFADVLAAASTNSNTNVQMMGETFKYAAPIAGTLGYSVQDTAIAVGLMANAGIKGSQAGTTLRAALTNLASPTKSAAKTMQELGIHTTDSQGKMLPLRDVIGQLRTSFKGLSKEQQAQAAESIFGKEAMSGMLAIINASEGDYTKLTAAIDGSSGSAEKMAKIMSNSDPITKATTSIKNSMISIGEVAMPVVAKIAEAVSKVAQKFQELPGPVKKGVLVFAGITAILAPVLLFVGKLLTTFGMLKFMLDAAGLSIGAIAAPVGIAIAAIAAIIAIGVLLYKNWDTIKAKAYQIGEGIKQAWEGVKNFFSGLWEGIKSGFTGFLTSIGQGFSNLWTSISTGFTNFISSIGTFFTSLPTTISSGLQAVITSVITWGANLVTTIGTIGSNFVSGIVYFFTDLPYKVGYELGELLGTVIKGWENIISTTIEMVPKIIDGAVKFFSELPDKIGHFLTESWDNVKNWSTNMINSAKELGSNFINSIASFFTQLPGEISDFLNSAWNNTKKWTINMVSSIRQMGTNVVNTVVQFFSQLPGRVAGFLNNVITSTARWANNMITTARRGATNFFNNVVDGLKGLPSRMLQIGDDIVTGLWNGICNAGQWLYNQVYDFAKGILDGMTSALGIGSPSKESENEVGRWIPAGVAVGIDKGQSVLDRATSNMNDIAIHSIGVDDISYMPNVDYGSLSETSNTVSSGGQPVNLIMNLGGRKFRAFVDDITKMQDNNIEFVEAYGI